MSLRRTASVATACLAAAFIGGTAQASQRTGGLQEAVGQRYALSRIEIESGHRQGAVTRQGTVLLLQEGGIPANELRVLRPMVHNPRSHIPNPARHLRNYARVEIDGSRARAQDTGAFRLPRGTRMVLLDLRAVADRVHFFTHTVEPVTVAPGSVAYGCTEFVFRTEGALLQTRDPAAIQQVIERWLKVEAAGRAAHIGVADASLLVR